MSITLESLGIDRMRIEDRLALVQAIWDSIATDGNRSGLTEAQGSELRRRVADDDANPDDVIPWEQVKARTLAGLKP